MASTKQVVTKVSYTDDITGQPLSASERVQLKRVDGKYVWTVDIARSTEGSVTGAMVKEHGTKKKLAGRPKGSTNGASSASEAAAPEVSEATPAADAS